uniref:Bulb-type lectin domain-containing protein n=1 Tax=Musa acuminata subsp. malaccensis TaxID=214687 RepID=A0A804K3W6_MUSAM
MGRQQRQAHHRFLRHSSDLRRQQPRRGGRQRRPSLVVEFIRPWRARGDAAAVLLDSGNIVLRADSNRILWQSFDHQIDSISSFIAINHLAELSQETASEKEVGSPTSLVSSATDKAYATKICISFTWWKSKPYRRSQVWTGNFFHGDRVQNPKLRGIHNSDKRRRYDVRDTNCF